MSGKYKNEVKNVLSKINGWKFSAIGIFIALMGLVLQNTYLSANPKPQRCSLPPTIQYGAVLEPGKINAWEIYNFVGRVNQLINTWRENGNVDYLKNLQSYRGLMTNRFLSEKYQNYEAKKSRGELNLRERFIAPLGNYASGDDQCGTYHDSCVQALGNNRWKVWIDVNITEYLVTDPTNKSAVPYRVKNKNLRIPFLVVYDNSDTKYNPWGLKLDKEYTNEVSVIHLKKEGDQ